MTDISERIADLSPEKRELLRQRLKRKRGVVARTQINPQKRDSNTFPLSFAQQRLWFLDRFEPGSVAYNIPAAVRLMGPLNVAALEQSFTEILRRHEALRTTFSIVEGRPVQLIFSPEPFTLPIVGLHQFPETERETEAQRLAIEEAQRPFDLAQGPLLRATLLRLDEAEHILLLTMHHIVSDGWSMGILFRELTALYEAYAIGKSSLLPDLPIQYADFAVWQREWLQGEVLEAQISYWKQQLGGNLPVLELPTERPRPAVQTFRGARQSVMLSKHLSERLKALSRREGVTLFMTLLATFNVLLYRYTGQDDIIVGSPIANRNRAEIEGLVGLFANTLVLRTDLSNNPTFRELLGRVREVALGAYDHQDLPFEKLVEILQPERDLSRNPLFQVMFILQNAPTEALVLPGLTLTKLGGDSRTAKFDLTLSLIDTDRGLVGELEYNTDLFNSATITRLAGHFQTLLEGIVMNPEQPISILPLLPDTERQQLLVTWNDTKRVYPEDQCIHRLFEAQVERTPDAVAVVLSSTRFTPQGILGHHKDKQLTYRELNRQANQLAHCLQRQGVEPGVLVGICLERSLEMVIGLLGILKAGGAYVPLDPAYPKERLTFILEDTQAPVLLTQQRLIEELPEQEAQLVCLDTNWEVIARESQENPVTEITVDDVAYVIYTSGSTGRPKGVLGLHRGAVNRFMWMWETYPFESKEICCQKTTLSFVDSVWEIFGPLLQGIPTIIIPDEALRDPGQLVQILAAHHVTRIVLVPSLLRVLLDTHDDLQDRLPHLRIWVTSGEALSPTLLQRFRESIPQGILLNLYGSSEVSADSTWYDTSNDKSLPSVPIGRPIANTQVYILDAHLQPVPIGVSGELHIGGVGLARGYLNRPELTAERFIRSSFSNELGERLYKTGDLVRYRPDGSIEFLGRKDHQVKIRGFRIELGEIEATLSQHPGVRQNVIIAREDTPNEKRLVAYIVPNEGQSLTVGDLRTFLRAKLPEYMVPPLFVTLEALPLTPNGKVNRQALPAPDVARPELETTYVAARNLVEGVLTDIWIEVLGREQVGVHDNFFELGGHSLLATQIISRINRYFRVEIPMRSLFEAPTVAGLAKTLVKYEIVPGQVATTARLIKDIDEMSADRIRAILREKKKAITKG